MAYNTNFNHDIVDHRDISKSHYSQLLNSVNSNILIGPRRIRISDFLTAGSLKVEKTNEVGISFPDLSNPRVYHFPDTEVDINDALYNMIYKQDELHPTITNVSRVIYTVLAKRGYIDQYGVFHPLSEQSGADHVESRRTIKILSLLKKICDIYLEHVRDWRTVWTFNSQQRLVSKRLEQVVKSAELYWRRENNVYFLGLLDTSEYVFQNHMAHLNYWGLLTCEDGTYGGQVEYVENMLFTYYMMEFGSYQEAGDKLYNDVIYKIPNDKCERINLSMFFGKTSAGAFVSSEVIGLLLHDNHLTSNRVLRSPLIVDHLKLIPQIRQLNYKSTVGSNDTFETRSTTLGVTTHENMNYLTESTTNANNNVTSTSSKDDVQPGLANESSAANHIATHL